MDSKKRFNKLMTHTITLTKKVLNVNGDLSIDTTYLAQKGFVQYGRKQMTTGLASGMSQGETIISTALVFLKSDSPITIDLKADKWFLTQTAPYARPEMQVLDVQPIDDPRHGETHHFEVLVR